VSSKSARQSYLVLAIGATRAALAQCYAMAAPQAQQAVAAIFVDTYGEDAACECIDIGASPGLWLEGDPIYMRAVAAGSAA